MDTPLTFASREDQKMSPLLGETYFKIFCLRKIIIPNHG